MKRKVINAGIVGAAYFARAQHIPNIKKSRNIRLRAVCDLRKDLLDLAEKDFNPDYVTTDIRELMDDKYIDVIFIVVAHEFHQKLVCQVAPSGKAIFVEKPMATTMPDCKKIVDSVRKYKNKLMVGFNRRFSPSMQYIKKAYDERNGKALITYRIVADKVRYCDGKMDIKKWGGDLIGEVCHIFDLLRWLTGEEPKSIFSEGWWDDNSITTMKWGREVVASICSGGIGDVRYPKERLEIFRDRGTLINDHFLEIYDGIYHPPIDKKTKLKTVKYPVSALYDSNITYGRGINDFIKAGVERFPVFDRVRLLSGKTETAIPAVEKGHLAEIEAFADAILEKKPSPIDEVDGSCATLLGLKAIESIKTGKPQIIKPGEYFLR